MSRDSTPPYIRDIIRTYLVVGRRDAQSAANSCHVGAQFQSLVSLSFFLFLNGILPVGAVYDDYGEDFVSTVSITAPYSLPFLWFGCKVTDGPVLHAIPALNRADARARNDLGN